MAKTRIFDHIRTFFGKAQGELSQLRGKISATREAIDDLQNRPISGEVARDKLKAAIAEIGITFTEKKFRVLHFLNEASSRNALEMPFKGADPFEVLCWLNPALVEEKMGAALEEFLSRNPGVDPAVRREQLAELHSQLRGLEREEELLIREASSVGMKVSRRAEASPEIVLGE